MRKTQKIPLTTQSFQITTIQLSHHLIAALVKLASALALCPYGHFHCGMGCRRKKRKKERTLHDLVCVRELSPVCVLELKVSFPIFPRLQVTSHDCCFHLPISWSVSEVLKIICPHLWMTCFSSDTYFHASAASCCILFWSLESSDCQCHLTAHTPVYKTLEHTHTHTDLFHSPPTEF